MESAPCITPDRDVNAWLVPHVRSHRLIKYYQRLKMSPRDLRFFLLLGVAILRREHILDGKWWQVKYEFMKEKSGQALTRFVKSLLSTLKRVYTLTIWLK